MINTPSPSFPAIRMRRTRAQSWSRAMVAENVLTPADLIWPIFVQDGDKAEPVPTMPGVSRLSIDLAVKAAEETSNL